MFFPPFLVLLSVPLFLGLVTPNVNFDLSSYYFPPNWPRRYLQYFLLQVLVFFITYRQHVYIKTPPLIKEIKKVLLYLC